MPINKEQIRKTIQHHDSSSMKLLRSDVLSPLGKKPEIALHRAQTYTQFFQESGNTPWVLKKAKAFRKHLQTVPLYIRNHDLLAGSICETPGAMPLFPELGIGECDIYLNENPHRKGYLQGKIPQDISDYWEHTNAHSFLREYQKDVLGYKVQDIEKVHQAGWQFTSCQAHLSPDFSALLHVGIHGVLHNLDSTWSAHATNPEGLIFLSACKESLLGLSEWIYRYGEFAKQQAKIVSGTMRKQQLEQIANTAYKVSRKPPETFYEAISLIWYAYQAMHIEGNGYSCNPGRLDQLLYPYYVEDIKKGLVSDDTVITLFENFFLKMKDNTFWGPEHNLTQGIVVSGSNQQGEDQTNELSWYLMKACNTMKLPEPLVWLRWHETVDTDFLHYCLEVLGDSTCFPLFMNDAVVVKMLKNCGVSEKDAFDYVPVGCNEIGIPGKLYYKNGGGVGYLEILQKLLEKAELGDAPANYKELQRFIEKQATEEIVDSYTDNLLITYVQKEFKQVPLTSCFFDGAFDRGVDCSWVATYNIPTIGCGFFPTFVDSIAAIKKSVFEDKTLTLSHIAQACKDNFAEHETVRSVLQKAPKHGNGHAYTNEIATWVSHMQQKIVHAYCKHPYSGSSYQPNCVTRSSGVVQGSKTGATPDGRLAGTPLPSSVAASVGAEQSGPTGVLTSLLALDASECWCGGYNANIRFANRMFSSLADREKLMTLLRVFFTEGGQELQMNSIDSKVLRAAKKRPEEYSDLVVRIAGFSEYFTRLHPKLQDEIIARESHGSA